MKVSNMDEKPKPTTWKNQRLHGEEASKTYHISRDKKRKGICRIKIENCRRGTVNKKMFLEIKHSVPGLETEIWQITQKMEKKEMKRLGSDQDHSISK